MLGFDSSKYWTNKVYVVLFTLVGIIHGSTFAYLSSVITSVEKRFGLKSQEIAWIYSGNEISQALLIFALPLISRVKKRPLWTGVSVITSGFGTVICGMANFLASDPPALIMTPEICSNDVIGPDCSVMKLSKDWFGISIVFLGIVLQGVGNSLFYSFGLAFVDDTMNKKGSALSLSLIFAFRLAGPFIGYILGFIFLKLYQDPYNTPKDFTESDHRWIGAWWLGFFILGSVQMFIGPFLCKFSEPKKSKISSSVPLINPNIWIKDIIKVLKRLFTNKVFTPNLLSSTTFLLGFVGFMTFFPKYIEYNYRIQPSSSGISGGATSFIASSFGIILSGILISRYKYSPRTLASWSILSGFISLCIFVGSIYLGCSSISFSDKSCEDCSCDGVEYSPVCSDNSMQFFSACHAGCNHKNESFGYGNCSCAPSKTVVSGYCDDPGCRNNFYIYMGLMAGIGVLASSTKVPNFLFSIRSVDPEDKSTSINLSVAFLSLFAFLPSTIITGCLMDLSCISWSSLCGENFQCEAYDNFLMRKHVGVFLAICFSFGIFFDILLWIGVKDLKLYDEEIKDTGQ